MSETPACLIVLSSDALEPGARISLQTSPLLIGAGLQNDLTLRGEGMRRFHASLRREGARWLLDRYGRVLVDGAASGAAPLADGAVLEIAGHRFRFSAGRAAASPTSPRPAPIPRSKAAAKRPSPPRAGEMPASTILETTRFDIADLRDARDPDGLLNRERGVEFALQAVNELMHIVDVPRLSRRVLDAAVSLVSPRTARLLLVDEAGAVSPGASWSALPDGADMPPISSTITRHTLESGEAVLAMDASADARWQNVRSVAGIKMRSLMCVPLARSGRIYGLLYLTNASRAGAFRRSDLELLSAIGAGAGLSLANARLYEKLQKALDDQVSLTESQRRFVPDEFLRALGHENIADVSLGDHVSVELSVLRTDLRSFTPLTERLGETAVMALLNRYFGDMEPPIAAHGGFIDSIQGDAIMALFEGPADRAVRAGVALARALESHNARAGDFGHPELAMGVGVTTGVLLLGTVGGPTHMKCTVVGDAANLATRVESATKHYGVRMLITGRSLDRLSDPSAFLLRPVSRVVLVGAASPETLYQVVDSEPPAAREAIRAQLPRYLSAWSRYRARDVPEAAALLEALAAESPDDRVVALFLARCRAALERGIDADWDGVERMTRK